MKDEYKTEKQLLNELQEMRQEIVELKASEAKRKDLEEALHFEHHQLLSIFDSIDEPVYVSNPDTYKVLYVNQTLSKKFGDVVGQKCYRAFQGLDSPCPFCTNERIFGENIGKPYIWEFQNRINRRWYRCIDKAIRWPDGQMVRCEMAIDITERKGVEEALKASEERYRTLFDESRDAVFITTREGKSLDINKSFLDLFGYSRKELLKMNILEVYVNPADRPKFQQEIEQKGSVRDFEMKFFKKDGTMMDCLLTATVRRGANGDILGYQGIIRDVTERKQMEEELRRSEEMFKTLVTNAPLGMNFIAKDGRYEYVNPKFTEIFGYTLEDVPTGKKWFEKATPDPKYRQEVVACWKEDLRRWKLGETPPRVFTVTCKDGSEKEILFRPAALIDERQLVMYEDITERKRMEETLRESEERYRTILEGIEDGYYEVDLAGTLTFFNDSLCRFFNITRDELMGMNNRAYMSPETAKKTYKIFNKVYVTGKPSKIYDMEAIEKDGTKRYVGISVSLMRDSEGEPVGFRGIVRDITERKRAEEELKKSEERYRTLVEDINDGYFIVQDGKFVYINQAFANLTGYSKGVILGGKLPIFFPKKYLRSLSKNGLKGKRNRNHKGQDEFEISRQDGEHLVLEIRSRVIDYNGRPAIAGICKDITERKKAEKDLKEKVEELEKWYHLTVDREVKMIQLKKRIQDLESKWNIHEGNHSP